MGSFAMGGGGLPLRRQGAALLLRHNGPARSGVSPSVQGQLALALDENWALPLPAEWHANWGVLLWRVSADGGKR